MEQAGQKIPSQHRGSSFHPTILCRRAAGRDAARFIQYHRQQKKLCPTAYFLLTFHLLDGIE
jgi:hypothetical protein